MASFSFRPCTRGETSVGLNLHLAVWPSLVAATHIRTFPSLDPESPTYRPDSIKAGWVLVLIPGQVVDDTNPPTPSPGPAGPTPASS